MLVVTPNRYNYSDKPAVRKTKVENREKKIFFKPVDAICGAPSFFAKTGVSQQCLDF